MTADRRFQLHRYEGMAVNLALADGSRLDDVSLVSARGTKLWVFDGGEDVFIPVTDIVDVWPSDAARSAA